MASMSAKLRERLPEISLEVFSVILAVLVALGVDQWREDRENAELARLARAKIEAEVISNAAELEAAGVKIRQLLSSLDTTLQALEDKNGEAEMGIRFPVAVLSSSAWDTSKFTQALNFMDFEWVLRTGRIYDLQAIYHQSQTEVLKYISAIDEEESRQPARMLRGFRSRVRTALEVQQGLLEDYQDLLNPTLGARP